MKNKQTIEDVTLYVEQRQPTEEEEHLFRAFMQARKGKSIPQDQRPKTPSVKRIPRRSTATTTL